MDQESLEIKRAEFYRFWPCIETVVENLPNQTSRVKVKGWSTDKSGSYYCGCMAIEIDG